METPIKAMYQAAKVNIPAQGSRVAAVTNTLAAELSTLDRQASHAGDPTALVSLLHVGGDMHSVLKTAVDSLDNMAAALIATANDYVSTDEQAEADYNNLSDSLRNTPLVDNTTDDLNNPEAPGHVVEPTGPMYPGQGDTQIDASEDPEGPTTEQEDREDNEPEAPEVPIPEYES